MQNKRFIPMQGAYNVRDLGGFSTKEGKTVKWGLIYRSDDLCSLTKSDLSVFAELNIKTIIDFRDNDERDIAPDILPETVSEVYNIPIDVASVIRLAESGDDADLAEILAGEPNKRCKEIDNFNGRERMKAANISFVEDFRSEYVNFFKIISDKDNLPAIFHCSAGKDRTGYAAALLLLGLGVDIDDVMQDYMLSAVYLRNKYQYITDGQPELLPLFTVHEEYIKAALTHIETHYGSVSDYLINILKVDLKSLKELYLE